MYIYRKLTKELEYGVTPDGRTRVISARYTLNSLLNSKIELTPEEFMSKMLARGLINPEPKSIEEAIGTWTDTREKQFHSILEIKQYFVR